MKRKVISLICLLLASVLLLTACNPLSKEEEEGEQDAVNRVTWEEHIANWKSQAPNEVGDTILAVASKDYRISAEVFIPDELESYEVKNIKISRHMYENPDVVLKECMEYFGLEVPTELVMREKEEFYENGDALNYMVVIEGEENTTISGMNGTDITISTPFLQNYANWELLSWNDRQQIGMVHAETMMKETEEELISEEEIADIKKQLESILGITFLENYVLETCTLERLQEVMEYEKKYWESFDMELNQNERWKVTEADEGTVLWFYQGYDGIPIFYDEPEFSITGASYMVHNSCVVVSSKEGLEGIIMQTPYDIQGEEETVQILSLGEFIEKHREMRSGIETHVVKVGLYYLPYYSGEGVDFIAKPVWYVQTEERDELGYPVLDSAIYDAVTGDEIPWY